MSSGSGGGDGGSGGGGSGGGGRSSAEVAAGSPNDHVDARKPLAAPVLGTVGRVKLERKTSLRIRIKKLVIREEDAVCIEPCDDNLKRLCSVTAASQTDQDLGKCSSLASRPVGLLLTFSLSWPSSSFSFVAEAGKGVNRNSESCRVRRWLLDGQIGLHAHGDDAHAYIELQFQRDFQRLDVHWVCAQVVCVANCDKFFGGACDQRRAWLGRFGVIDVNPRPKKPYRPM